MIPNFAPMAAVYRRPGAAGSRDGRLFSLPVVAWDTDGSPLVYLDGPGLDSPSTLSGGMEMLGVWNRGWTPTYDQMYTLLPSS